MWDNFILLIDFNKNILVDCFNLGIESNVIKSIGENIVIGTAEQNILIFSFKKEILIEEKKILLPNTAIYIFKTKSPEKLGIVFRYFDFVAIVEIGQRKFGEDEKDQILIYNFENSNLMKADEEFGNLKLKIEIDTSKVKIDAFNIGGPKEPRS